MWSFNGAAVSGFDSAPRGGETKGCDRERKCRQCRSLGGGDAQHDGSRPDGWSGGVGLEEGDDPGGPVLGQKDAVAWADFRKFQGKSRRAAKATGPN
jgi:hypothetical protein